VFQDAARHHADRVAITTSSSELTYRELDEWSNNVA
jgi:non-ribosomal peptide synthetase component E (peptide arylation enzyme)